MKEMMQECMKKCRWCPLIPVTVGIIFLLLGYFLDAEIIRMLWIILSIIMILMGIICFTMMNIMSKKCSEELNEE